MSGTSALVRLTLLAFPVLLAGCHRADAAQPTEPPTTFVVASPRVTDTSYEREYVGEVHAVRYAEVRARLKGVVESVAVDEGEAVKGRQLLFTIGARELQQEELKLRSAMRSAEAELRLAQLEQENTQMLFEKNIVSSAERALAQAKSDALNAKLDEAKAHANQVAINLTYAKVRAPFDGVVNRIPRKAGSIVGEDELLTTITDTSEVYVYFRVSEREYLEYVSGSSVDRPKAVSFKLADGSMHSSTGVIDTVESEISRETGNLAFRARFPNASGLLKHGSSGKLIIKTDLRNVLTVPQKSTFEVQGHLFVYALDADNRARSREIVTKFRNGESFVIAAGLTPQDRFIVEGVQKVKDGVRVVTAPSIQ